MALIRALSGGSGGGGIDELKIIDTTSGCSYSSSSAYSGYSAQNAFDCNLKGAGFYPASSSYSGAYLRIDLGTSRHIKAIGFGLQFSTYNFSITHVFDVQYGSSYTTKEQKTITFPADESATVQIFPIDIESQYIGFSWVSCDHASSSVKILLFE